MPSSGKTPRLGLNSFVGSDKPKMDDFNYDNQQLEQLVAPHLDDAVAHLTAAEHEEMRQSRYEIQTYVGDNRPKRVLEFGFAPRFGFVFPVNWPLQLNNGASAAVAIVLGGFFSREGCSSYLALSENQLSITHHISLPTATMGARMNWMDVTYVCVAFR